MQSIEPIPIMDRIDGLLQPFENGFFTGHEDVEARFLAGSQSERLHHAWLLNGPAGVGKASFAFRIARAFVERPENARLPDAKAVADHSNMNHPVFRRVATAGHPNILHLRIPYDAKKKTFKTQLTVDEIRKSVGFFGATAGEAGWRVAVVDNADQMTISAANALLKILEEPPKRTLFFVLTSQPGRLLPTIKSRCQHLNFEPLSYEDIVMAMKAASHDDTIEPEELIHYRHYLGGSVRRAYQFLSNDFAALVDDFAALVAAEGQMNMAHLHGFADKLSVKGAEARYDFFVDLVEDYISNKVRTDLPHASLVQWSEVWQVTQNNFDLEARLNLDRKQTILDVFHDIAEVSSATNISR